MDLGDSKILVLSKFDTIIADSNANYNYEIEGVSVQVYTSDYLTYKNIEYISKVAHDIINK